MPDCIICLSPFTRRPKSRRVTCSRSCAVALAWQKNPEGRIAGIAASKQRPDQLAITALTNARRWADPQEHEKLSEQNRRLWRNYRVKSARSRAIKRAWTPEMRAEAAARKSVYWAAKTTAERKEHMRIAIEVSVATRRGRICESCEVYKPARAFRRRAQPTGDDLYEPICKKCHHAAAVDRERAHPANHEFPFLPSAETIKSLSDEECEQLFIGLRWPNGLCCPACGETHVYENNVKRGRRWQCSACPADFTPSSGTPFANHKVSWRIIITALSLVQRQAGIVIIHRVGCELGLSYKTAYCLVGKAQEFLSGKIEGRSAFVGYASTGGRSRPEAPRLQIGIADGLRQCSRCGESKPLDRFSRKAGAAADWGLRVTVCKDCLSLNESVKQRERWAALKAADAATPIIHRPAAQLLQQPRYRSDALWDTRSWWTSQQKHDLTTLVEAQVPPGRAAVALGRSPTSIAWYARDLLPTLPPAWRALIAPKRLIVPAAPRLLVYPYLPNMPKAGDEGGELMMAVNNAVPKYLPDHIRADICQELVLAILTGELTLDDLGDASNRMMRKRLGMGNRDLSLEDLLRDDDQRAPLEVTMPAGIMERLEW